MTKCTWEDFLNSYDTAQENVEAHWGATPGTDIKDKANKDKIILLEAQLDAPGRTDAEKESARRLIEKLRHKGGK